MHKMQKRITSHGAYVYGKGDWYMLAWLNANMATVIIGVLLLAAVVAVVAALIRSHREDGSLCGRGCRHCLTGNNRCPVREEHPSVPLESKK